MNTYITLILLSILMVKILVFLLKAMIKKDKKSFSTLNLPLDNKGKWWYN